MKYFVAAVVAAWLGGCGDNIVLGRHPDAAADAAPDAVHVLFGEPCPIASVPGHIYLCHQEQGACVAEADGNHCRPFCVDDKGIHCGAIGGVLFDPPNTACVCVPPPSGSDAGV